MKKKFLLSIT